MKNNKILALFLLFMVSKFSFAAEFSHALKDGGSTSDHISGDAPRLFSPAEHEDFETGMGIIQDRIYQKQEIARKLRDEKLSLRDRYRICADDFIDQPLVFAVDTSLEKEIGEYSHYLGIIKSIYSKAYELAWRIQSASNDSEKNTHQNNLYYYLSYKIMYFQNYVEGCGHKIPEHSREDTFFEIIREKLCAGATKEYDVVTQYVKLTLTSHGTTNIGIDNQKLFDTYNIPLGTLQKEKMDRHPAFHGAVQAQSAEALALMCKINDELSPLVYRASSISRNLGDVIRNAVTLQISNARNQNDEEIVKEDILKFYYYFGPHILRTIDDYETCSNEFKAIIQTIEMNLKKWLDKFNRSKEFKRLEAKDREYVRGYIKQKEAKELQEQRAAEAQRRAIVAAEAEQRRLAAVQKKAEKEARKKERDDALAMTQVKHAATPTAHDVAINNFSAMSFSGSNTNTSASTSAIIAENCNASLLPSMSAETGQPTEVLPDLVVRKEKVKTRGPSANTATAGASTQSKEREGFILPDYFQDETFQSLLEYLLRERNERNLKSEFKRLKKDYDIISVNEEKKNKGYFMVVSPVTQKRAVKTYHNLHDPENPFASLFMAVRDVLSESGLSIALSLG